MKHQWKQWTIDGILLSSPFIDCPLVLKVSTTRDKHFILDKRGNVLGESYNYLEARKILLRKWKEGNND
jgi:hypothetical protein